MKHYSLLCLGDSYTIGEGVPLHESFPYQTLQLLRKAGHHFYAPEIIAKTGWTSLELAAHLLHNQQEEHYDFVTLLIGVNNQYRGLSTIDFKEDFEFLLRKALHYTNQIPQHVIVVSIPDWGITPFAKNHDAKLVSKAIDTFNNICKTISNQYAVHYINITNNQRKNGSDTDFLAPDLLHPSGKEYAKWGGDIFEKMNNVIMEH